MKMSPIVTPSSSKRLPYLDVARGLAIVFMIFQHAMILHETTGGEGDTVFGNVFLLLGTAPAAPVFMVIMGVLFMKSDKGLAQDFLRGLKLFALGYVLNFFRFTLPLWVSGTSSLLDSTAFEMLFEVDILQLAGLSLIAAGLLRKAVQHRLALPSLILIILILSPMLWGQLSQYAIFLPFWGTESFVSFPFFPWVIYPLLGMTLSPYLLNPQPLARDRAFQGQSASLLVRFKSWTKEKPMRTMGIATLVLGAILCLTATSIFPIGDYYRSGLGLHLAMIGFVLLWLQFLYDLFKKRPELGQSKWVETLAFWSKYVSVIYILQWLLYGWSLLLFSVNQQTDVAAFGIGLGMLLITHLLVRYTPIKRLQTWL